MHRFQPHMVTNALLALRADLIREGGPGLEHVEALLVLRGSNLPPVPRKLVMRFKRNGLKRAIREALAGGPLRLPDVAQRVSEASGVPYDRAPYRSVYAQLNAMRGKGLVVGGGGKWGLPIVTATPHQCVRD